MIRAQSEEVPEEALTLFRARDLGKDRQRFWRSLEMWYRDPESGEWFAPWRGFAFPDEADFEGARFLPGALLTGATFAADAVFREARLGEVNFRGATFGGGTFFERARFAADASFREATFAQNCSFREAMFGATVTFREAVFSRNAWFPFATFRGQAFFRDATVARTADFSDATFLADAHFDGAELQRGLFVDTAIHTRLNLGVKIPAGGTLEIDGARGAPREEETESLRPPEIWLGAMSLVGVELRSFDPAEVRFVGTRDIERLSIVNIEWRLSEDGYRVADERDFLAARTSGGPSPKPGSAPAGPGGTWREVERIYRALRKNYEDRSDRFGAHGWYFAEMELGRRHADRPFTRRARDFYKLTSGYGLSAVRAAACLLVVLAAAFLLFLVPADAFCPMVSSGGKAPECAGWTVVLQSVFMAVSFQGLPDGVSLPGLAGNAVWVLARFGGAAMLLSIGVAFRNQIAR